MLIAGFIGESRSGKTTLIEELIRHYVTNGKRVAAIKHTHHPLNDRNEGDTARFLAAGAMPVIFAGDGEAIVFPSRARIAFDDPRQMLPPEADVVLIEGFKRVDAWPRIELQRGAWRSAAEIAAILGRIGDPCS
jgi:molybdopterin-guanine dinucleotide biosynthesis protein B